MIPTRACEGQRGRGREREGGSWALERGQAAQVKQFPRRDVDVMGKPKFPTTTLLIGPVVPITPEVLTRTRRPGRMESHELSVDYFVCVDDPAPPCNGVKGGNKRGDGERKRRFSDKQIKSLECTFEAQTKLEPRKKLQLASELGLQPRQVAIWFQNKRARWKSKQLETDFGALRADYDALLSSFESLKKEKQSLAKQLQKLAELLKKPTAGSSDRGDFDRGGAEGEDDRKPSLASAEGSELTLMVCSAEEKLAGQAQKQEPSFFAGDAVVDGCFGLAGGQQCYFETTGGFSYQSCGSSSDWWEFWPLNE